MTEALDYLDDIIEAIEKFVRFTDGMSYEECIEDEKTVDQCSATSRWPVKRRKTSRRRSAGDSHVPWAEMAGMRDKLIHGYATIELRIVWTTVQEEIPSLTGQIKALRDELDDE